MTVYIHFYSRMEKSAVKLHNVASVNDAGKGAVEVRMLFTDDRPMYLDVSHVAVQPATE